MRIVLSMAALGLLAGCVAQPRNTYPNDRPGPVAAQDTQPFCSSGPNGRTAACAATIGVNAIIHSATK